MMTVMMSMVVMMMSMMMTTMMLSRGLLSLDSGYLGVFIERPSASKSVTYARVSHRSRYRQIAYRLDRDHLHTDTEQGQKLSRGLNPFYRRTAVLFWGQITQTT